MLTTTYYKMARFLILLGPKKFKIAKRENIRRAIGILAARANTTSMDFLMDMKQRGMLTQEEVTEVLSWPI